MKAEAALPPLPTGGDVVTMARVIGVVRPSIWIVDFDCGRSGTGRSDLPRPRPLGVLVGSVAITGSCASFSAPSSVSMSSTKGLLVGFMGSPEIRA